MTTPSRNPIDPKLDLVLERVVDVSPAKVWSAWTEPKHLKHWFAPKPWTVSRCEVDLRPGGIFHVVMCSPEGEEMAGPPGAILEVVPQQRLVFTDALGPGYRPNGTGFFTAEVTLEAKGKGTRYTAIARHGEEEKRRQHEKMGFLDGWGTCLDQLVALAKSW